MLKPVTTAEREALKTEGDIAREMLVPTIIVDVVVLADRNLLARYVCRQRIAPKDRMELLDGFSKFVTQDGTIRIRNEGFPFAKWEQALGVIDKLFPELTDEADIATSLLTGGRS